MGSKFDISVLTGVSAGDVFHFTLDPGGSVTVGRATDADLVLQDPMVSRKHLRIERRPDGFFLTDEGSTHGTVHMGFHLKSGAEGARMLHNGDEFKIGELLFRVNFDESVISPASIPETAKTAKPQAASAGLAGRLPKNLQGKKGAAVALLLGVLLVLLLFPDEKKGLPAQRSNEVLKIPSYGVIGYFPGPAAAKKEQKDTSHLDKAQFDIPASDVLIEFDYAGDSPVTVWLDDVQILKLEPSPSSWQIQQMIVRGLALGRERKLIVDNLDFPTKDRRIPDKPKRWAVRDVRASPLSSKFGIQPGFDSHLNAAMGLVEGIDKGPEGMFLLIRALQTAAAELLKELKIDAVGYRVDPGAEEVTKVADIGDLRARLDVIRRGRESQFSFEASSNYLKELTRVIAQLDAELWRRVNNRLSQAKLSSRVKNYIEAHDQLLSTQSMFPAEADYRWTLANRLLMNKKIVPKPVRENPENYRK